MKPVLDEQSALIYTSVVILVLTFFIFLVAQRTDQPAVHAKVDTVYRSLGLITPRERLIEELLANLRVAFHLRLNASEVLSGPAELTIPLEQLFVERREDLRATAIPALQTLASKLYSAQLAAELVVQSDVKAATGGDEMQLLLKRVATLVRLLNDGDVEKDRFQVSGRAATDPGLRIRLKPVDIEASRASEIATGNLQGWLSRG